MAGCRQSCLHFSRAFSTLHRQHQNSGRLRAKYFNRTMAISVTQPNVDTALPRHTKESKLTPTTQPVPNLFSLKDRTVVVTGAGRGLGITLAAAVLEAGGDVVCLDILPEPSKTEWANLALLQKGSDLSATYHNCNVTDETSIETTLAEAADVAKARGKPIRGLIHCAGIQQMMDAIEYPLNDFKKILDVNVTGSFLLAKHTARIIRDAGNQGSLVMIASMSGQIANRVRIPFLP